jgi:hypothetical protein
MDIDLKREFLVVSNSYYKLVISKSGCDNKRLHKQQVYCSLFFIQKNKS